MHSVKSIARKLLLIAATVALAGVVSCGGPDQKADQAPPRPAAPPSPREIREALLAEFQPVTLTNCAFERIGDKNDGGYVVCGNLLTGVKAGYSYGIANTDEWGCSVSGRLRIPVHQYDCFDTRQPACKGGTTVFHDECVGPARLTEEGRLFDTVEAQIARNKDDGKRLVVKMDVEGAEWPSLLATPDSVLGQIDQLTVEFHRVDQALNVETIRKLKRIFHVVNVHYNNSACDPRVAPFPSWAFQVLLVNKSLGVVDPAATIARGPNPLDALDDPTRSDCQLPPGPH